MEVLLDSQTLKDTNVDITSNQIGHGQSFDSGVGGILGSVEIHLSRLGSPSGEVSVSLYAHSGVYGTSSVPSGSALVTSTIPISSLVAYATGGTWCRFHFTESYILSPNTKYCISVMCPGGTLDISNNVNVWVDATDILHPGNAISTLNAGSSWSAVALTDTMFRVYTKTEDTPGNMVRRVKVGTGMSIGERAL